MLIDDLDIGLADKNFKQAKLCSRLKEKAEFQWVISKKWNAWGKKQKKTRHSKTKKCSLV